jgi:hypothetical protein
MSETRELVTMGQMLNEQIGRARLGKGLAALEETEKLKRIGLLTVSLPESERVYFKVLAENLEDLLVALTPGLKEESARRVLYDSFGLPKQEIVAEATPVYVELLTNLTNTHHFNTEKVYRTKETLREFIHRIEQNLLTIFVIQVNKLDEEREKCLKSIQTLGQLKSEGPTSDGKTGEMVTSLSERLTDIERQKNHFEASQIAVFEYLSNLEQQVLASERVDTHKDIAAPNPELAL